MSISRIATRFKFKIANRLYRLGGRYQPTGLERELSPLPEEYEEYGEEMERMFGGEERERSYRQHLIDTGRLREPSNLPSHILPSRFQEMTPPEWRPEQTPHYRAVHHGIGGPADIELSEQPSYWGRSAEQLKDVQGEVRALISNTFLKKKEYLYPEELDLITGKIMAKVADPEHYLYDANMRRLKFYTMKAVENYIISRIRRGEAAGRRLEREKAKQEKEMEQIELREKAIPELEKIISNLENTAKGRYAKNKKRQLKMLRLIYLENLTPAEAAKHFPNASRDVVYQMKRRGLKMISPYINESPLCDEITLFLRGAGGSGVGERPGARQAIKSLPWDCEQLDKPSWSDYLDELDYMDESELMLEKRQLERQVQESLADEQEIPPMVQDKLKEVVKRLRKKESLAKEAAEYQGRKVKLNDPIRNPPGSKKKFTVYVKDGDKVKKIQFGDPKMEIKRDNPKNRKNFRSRHNCDNPGPKTKARYWSCYQWRGKSKVNN